MPAPRPESSGWSRPSSRTETPRTGRSRATPPDATRSPAASAWTEPTLRPPPYLPLMLPPWSDLPVDVFDVEAGENDRQDQQHDRLSRRHPLIEHPEAHALDIDADQLGGGPRPS